MKHLLKRAITLALVAFVLVLPVEAKPKPFVGEPWPANSLYREAVKGLTPEETRAMCDRIVSRQDAGRVGMHDAAFLYLNGGLHNAPCVKVDYYKAWQLARASGYAGMLQIVLDVIAERVAGGNQKAIMADARIRKETGK